MAPEGLHPDRNGVRPLFYLGDRMAKVWDSIRRLCISQLVSEGRDRRKHCYPSVVAIWPTACDEGSIRSTTKC